MKSGSTVVVLALIIAGLTGCAAPEAGRPVAGQAPPDPGKIRTVTPTWIAGLRMVSDGSACQWSASYPAVPGADALTATLRDMVRNRFGTASENSDDGAECEQTEDPPKADISSEFLAASGDVVGVEVTTHDYASAGSGIGAESYWFDGRTGKSLPATALVSDTSMDSFVAAVTKAVSGREGVQEEQVRDALNPEFRSSTLADLSFTETGGLVVQFPQGSVAPGAAGRPQVIIPPADAGPLLSDFGRRAQQQAIHPGQRLDLADVSVAPAVPTEPVDPPAASTVDCLQVKCVALTFDDGPGPYTGQLLATLEEYKAHATFFVVGQNATYDAGLVRQEAAAGHEIGNHSWSHPSLAKLSAEEIQDQLARTDEAIQNATGRKPTLIRPPYGAINDTVRASSDRPLILWNVDTEDWKYHDSAKVTQTVLDKVKPGDVVLIHDIHQTSVAAVPAILAGLKERSYQFVTITQLFGSTPLAAGTSYSSNSKAFGRG
ncbi:peptidoglycan/xylan/chitin deacetylase (PgdA/CDA1 family) [Kibdelosporangium banguiense]|uniref:Peptidoglycan/xylan/chitin deacetylase (PgdA/CDA1 family) n=1 Tax=Kibdelosporangium banguiense TaxID=1365924 RepID=A0ABS4TVI1_9PSEU|nr:polysaccharide deacetylase family protein [Kibdelosporangium banguiense]MBP2327941.1 peptidoglycan/xylan/chitin deacetylase (PgdA/CDA1 family) [Kibdelosporangium banguiense]